MAQLALCALALAAVVAAFVSLRYGYLAGVAAASVFGCWLASLVAEMESSTAQSLIPMFVILMGGIAFVGYIEPEPPLTALLLIPAAPLALWICQIGPLARLQGTPAVVAQTLVVLAGLMFAVALVAIRQTTTLLLATCLVVIFGGHTRADQRPNIMVFIADDQGYGDLGCYGNHAIQTPHVDQLAGEGMRFDHAFLTTSSCSPSRASILTGRYPHNTNAEDLHQPLPDEQRTMAQYLKHAGYYCASIGKWHLGNQQRKHWDQVVECAAAVTAENAVKVLRGVPEDRPFFLWIASKDPHRPYQLNSIAQPHQPADVRVPPYLPDHPKIRKELALYYDEVSRFDECVGSVRAALA
ncbi:MAG: sulfatase-like hydrolase/transferase, partial [Pseudomonadales bacterium]